MTESGLAIGYRDFHLPRLGYALEECQDASAADPRHGRFAIADGAAESPYSALWRGCSSRSSCVRRSGCRAGRIGCRRCKTAGRAQVSRPTEAINWLTEPASAGCAVVS